MEIVNISPFALGIKGGVEIHLTYQSARLRELGHNVVNLVGAGSPDKFERYDQIRDPFFSIDTEQDDFSDDHKDIIVAADEVHLHNVHTLDSRKYRVFSEFTRRNVLDGQIYLHAHNFNGTVAERDAIESFFGADIIVYSDFMQQTIDKECRRRSKISQCFFPIKSPTDMPSSDGSITKIIQPTRFNKAKGSHFSLSSIATLLDEGHEIYFTHAGFNWSKYKRSFDEIFSGMPKQKKEAVKYWIQEGNIILNSFEYEELLDEIDNSHLVVLPTTASGLQGEPFGIAAYQSIALNKFIIASDSGHYGSLFHEDGYTHSVCTTANSENQFFTALLKSLTEKNHCINERQRQWASDYVERYLSTREATLDRYR